MLAHQATPLQEGWATDTHRSHTHGPHARLWIQQPENERERRGRGRDTHGEGEIETERDRESQGEYDRAGGLKISLYKNKETNN